MLTPHAFLRRMPRALQLEDRITLDAMVLACDLAELAFGRLTELLTQAIGQGSEPVRAPPQSIAYLAMYAWTIVDNVHNFRSFAKKLEMRPEGVLAQFVETYEVATRLRNAMDHRHTNLGNLSKKGRTDPIYGALSFMAPKQDSGGRFVHQVSLGGLHHDAHVFPVIDTWCQPAQGQISNVRMGAFDATINLSDAVPSMLAAQRSLNESVEQNVKEQIHADAMDKGYDPGEVLKDTSGGPAWFVVSLPNRS